MPEPSNPSLSTSPADVATPTAPRKMLRLNKACRFIKAVALVCIVAFFCAYLRTYIRYGTPHTQPRAFLAHVTTQTSTRTPSHLAPSRLSPRRLSPRRRAFLPVRHAKRHPRHPGLYHLATLRRLRHFFSQLLDVRS